MSDNLEKKVDKILVEVLGIKEGVNDYVTKEEFNKKIDQVLTNTDGLAKKVEKVEQEQTANIAAHDRFEERITKLEAGRAVA
ncbi:hypothetical protein COT99_00850 [Candidatus Falkowbacteria bacterium CG10_big_fil_rev_8_21_14_0_10_43_10]|uniref:Uncharacterized protein n=1 Tax=Candidatus Falkowbacteria bacterium CG10_big_fil_rev_8_21_14_0_10_43_10 TaxID=1974567 RepID=A0A2H0V2U6_9BACT|nr:MAG: hypothetical protein COT99_00850 [Candidatus Falkowbacteria bacterium CG10_big_fil_rev_8_21_14_0_10_43_10]